MNLLGGAVFLLGLLVLIFMKVPIGFAIAGVALVGFYIYDIPTIILSQQFYAGVASSTWVAVPLFIFAGTLMGAGGMSRRLVNLSEAILSGIRGGLGVTCIFACAIFAAISGSSPATSAAIGSIMLPEMRRKGYPEAVAAGIVASGGVLGVLIPPSIILIAYGVLAEVSIAKLFLGAMAPGIIVAGAMMVVTYFRVRGIQTTTQAPTFATVWPALKRGALSLAAPVIVLGSIYGGILTPTESAIAAVAYAIVVGLLHRELTWPDFADALKATVVTTGVLAVIWAASASYSYVLTLSGIAQDMTAYVASSSSHGFVVLLLISLLVVVLGCYVNAMGMVIMLSPILVPVVKTLGYDLVAFGILFTLLCEIGYITPPVGTNLFVVKSITKDATLSEISLACLPYMLLLYAVAVLFIFVPGIVTFLPNLVY